MRRVHSLAVLALLAATAVACKPDLLPATHERLPPYVQPWPGREAAQLHPAVLEFVLTRPELPLVAGAVFDGDVEAARVHAAEIADDVNAALASSGALRMGTHDRHVMAFRTVDPESGTLLVAWDLTKQRTVFALFDLHRVPGAFSSQAKLDVETVERLATYEVITR